ncbi:uracil-DNA glycosylase-like protein [Dichotomocladium elegans]|nr:uracil-DNA glycosylase-like protein [Dichotomocladium elegans]
MSLKRALTDGSTNVSKKPAPTRQASLLSMFKPKVAPTNKGDDTTVAPLKSKDLLADLSEEHKELLELEMTTMHPEWIKALKPEFTKAYFIQLKKFLRAETAANKKIFPPAPEIYSWSNYTPPSKVKVVIIGQDPYHNDGQAHGLCFSVKKGVNTPPSLVNIYEALRRDYPEFKKPNHGFLENWAKQGVLLLNTSLTVRAHEPSSHSKKGWEQLTDSIISHLSEKKAHIVFMLWGAHAQARAGRIDKTKHLVLKAVHPSPLSAHRGFFDCNHFKQANEYLNKNAREPINWNCLDN